MRVTENHRRAADSKNGPQNPATTSESTEISRERLVQLLNEDLAREYQAIIAYVCYSQIMKGAEFMKVASELEQHASEELSHALIIAAQIDYFGGTPVVMPKQVRLSEDSRDLLRYDLDNEIETIRNYRERVKQCEKLGEFAVAEHLRKILIDEQHHQITLATALGLDDPASEITSKKR